MKKAIVDQRNKYRVVYYRNDDAWVVQKRFWIFWSEVYRSTWKSLAVIEMKKREAGDVPTWGV